MLWGSTARTGVREAWVVTMRILIVPRFGCVEHAYRASDSRIQRTVAKAQRLLRLSRVRGGYLPMRSGYMTPHRSMIWFAAILGQSGARLEKLYDD